MDNNMTVYLKRSCLTCKNYYPKAKIKCEWREGDWAWHVDAENFGMLVKLCIRDITDGSVIRSISIPTPEQLLVEYKDKKCLTWEDKDGFIIIQHGIDDCHKHRYHHYNQRYDDRFLVPDCLAIVSYDQQLRHYPNGIKYPWANLNMQNTLV